MGATLQNSRTMIVDSSYCKQCPKMSISKIICDMADRINNMVEADCGVWFHAVRSKCKTIIIVANDTDVFMYGLALFETGFFKY
jgi:hypothetical protein